MFSPPASDLTLRLRDQVTETRQRGGSQRRFDEAKRRNDTAAGWLETAGTQRLSLVGFMRILSTSLNLVCLFQGQSR